MSRTHSEQCNRCGNEWGGIGWDYENQPHCPCRGAKKRPTGWATAYERYRHATNMQNGHQRQADHAGRQREEAVAELHALGLSYRDIAADLGLSHSRVAQMVARHRDS